MRPARTRWPRPAACGGRSCWRREGYLSPVRRLALVLAAPLLIAACGGSDAPRAPARTYVLDESRASFRGVSLGDAEREVVSRFGPDQGKPDGPVGPLGDHNYDNGPGTFASAPGRPRPGDRTPSLRYDGMAFVT